MLSMCLLLKEQMSGVFFFFGLGVATVLLDSLLFMLPSAPKDSVWITLKRRPSHTLSPRRSPVLSFSCHPLIGCFSLSLSSPLTSRKALSEGFGPTRQLLYLTAL